MDCGYEVKEQPVNGTGHRNTVPPKLEIRLLGRFEVISEGKPIAEKTWGRRKTKTLLKILLTDPGRVFTQDQLIDALFGGEDVAKTRDNLYGRVSRLRRVLEPRLTRGGDSAFILRDGQGYSFRVDACAEIDIVAFQRRLTEAQALAGQKDWGAAAERFEEAIGVYRGEFLPEERYEDWAEQTRLELQRCYLNAMSELSKCYEQLGRLRQAISCCQRILSLEPYREDVIREVMRYQSEAGQRDQALDSYREGERALREHLDVEPAAETRALRDRIAMLSEQQPRLDPRRIAVLPLQYYGSDPEEEYIAAGMTEELIGCIAKVKDLRVVARTSVMRFQNSKEPVSRIAQALSVGTVLEGSVRRAGNRIRINAQLIDVATEDHIWAEAYDQPFGEILAAQYDVATKVAKALAVQLLPQEAAQLREEPPEDPGVRELYLKARHFGQSPLFADNEKAMRYFEHVLKLDPNHAGAHAGLAACYTYSSETLLTADEAHRLAKAAATRALELNPGLAEGHTALGLIQLTLERDPSAAEQSLRRAVTLNPSYAQAHLWLGFLVMWMGSFEEAVAEFRRAQELDPLSAYTYYWLSIPLAASNRFAEAFDALDKALEINPSHFPSLGRIVQYRWLLWDWNGAADAIAEHERHKGEIYVVRERLYRMFHALYTGDTEESLRLAEGWPESLGSFKGQNVPGQVQLGRHFVQEILLNCRKYEASLEQMRRFMAANPSHTGTDPFDRVLFHAATAHELLGQFEEAIEVLDLADEICFGQGEWRALTWLRAARGMIYAAEGQPDQAREIVESLECSKPDRETASACAVISFRLGLLDNGFKWLNRAVDNHDKFLLTILTHPWFDLAREDPRFESILQRMNLME
jgi:TolB-like protein/Flp pilus assembly protein TadD/DNA-binding winged helix-turn-helix (wHTH) protein